MTTDDLHAWKQVFQVRGDQLFQRKKFVHRRVGGRSGPGGIEIAQRDETGQALRDLDPGKLALLGLGITRLDGQRQGQVRQEWKRVSQVDRQGRDDWKHRATEVLLRQPHGSRVQRRPVAHVDAVFGQSREQRGQEPRRCSELPPDGQPDARQLLPRAQAVRAGFDDGSLELLVETRDPNHEELVQVGRVDRQEFESFQQRPVRCLRLRENPFVECQPRHFAVDVQLGPAQIRAGLDLLIAGDGRARLGGDRLQFRHLFPPHLKRIL